MTRLFFQFRYSWSVTLARQADPNGYFILSIYQFSLHIAEWVSRGYIESILPGIDDMSKSHTANYQPVKKGPSSKRFQTIIFFRDISDFLNEHATNN